MSTADKPAYPTNVGATLTTGMTLREHYAGLAMQGMFASGLCKAERDELLPKLFAAVASMAVQQADALIAELERAK